MSTLTVPPSVPPASEDCDQLKKAFDGWGTNEKLIISILAHRTAEQRRVIRQTYAQTYGADLLKTLDKELSSNFERIILLWTLDSAERDALLISEATSKWHQSNQVLLEVACTRSSYELFLVKQAYHARFKRSVEEDVAHHTTGDFRKLLVPLVSTFRYEGPEVNMTLAKSEANILHKKIHDKAYNDEEVIRILTTRSKAQVQATVNDYNNEFGHGINKDLKADPKDDFLAALRSIVKCLTNPQKYFEKMVRKAINKTGTDEDALTRIITTRTEVDMRLIKDEYKKRNSVTLEHAIAKDTHGDYEDFLTALVGEA